MMCKNEDKTPCIVNHRNKWRCTIRFTPRTLDVRAKKTWSLLETNAGLGAVEEKFLLPHLAIKHRFLGRPARSIINKQTGGYTYENGKSKNIQHSESRLGAY